MGDLDDVARLVTELEIDVVAIQTRPGWTAKRLHRLAWELEGTGVELVVDPGLMEIGGPRLHVAPVDGLPLLRLSEPRFSGVTRVAKRAFDQVAAALLLLVLAPVLLVVAALIKRDGGPVFFRQERVGQAGATFRMIKFRSMVVDAIGRSRTLTSSNDGSGPLFKMKIDPRLRGVGRVLHRLSLDELPQLFNFIVRSMSLVGPVRRWRGRSRRSPTMLCTRGGFHLVSGPLPAVVSFPLGRCPSCPVPTSPSSRA